VRRGQGSGARKSMSGQLEPKSVVAACVRLISGGRLIKVLQNSVGSVVRRNPLAWALPVQALLLLSNLDLLDPWNDEWFTLSHVPQPLSQVVFTDPMSPPLYNVLLHYWIQLPWMVSPLASMRTMSAVWALVATVVIYALWLRREGPRFQTMFLGLWVLSPCLLLHARMARSYSMQLALASLAIYTALQWAEQPRNWKWLLAYVGSSAALLYTHYLSGLAVAAAVCVTFLLKKRFSLAAVQVALLGLLYAPWAPTLGSSLGRWIGAPHSYEGGNVIFDQIVRFAYLFMSFSFGETVSTVSLLLSIALIPFVIYALWRTVGTRPPWLPTVLVATGIAWIGVSRFEPFVFMPNHLIFVLPFFLFLIVRQINPMAFAALLVLYAGADYAYFAGSGFLVKPYATPYEEMADTIRNRARGRNTIVAVDPWGSFVQPLLNGLGDSVRVTLLSDEASAREVLTAARSGSLGPSAILLWRRTSDVSPVSFVTKLEQDLSVGHEVWRREFIAYSLPERWARRLLRGPGQPEYYYRLSEFR
jgi:Dolichyl-phosphate-mannose-protein mannosyltransferase